jgi:hypothetical protein
MAEKKPSDFRAEWDTLKREAVVGQTTPGLPVHDSNVKALEAAIAGLNASKDAVAHGAWLTTARDLADLALLAEVVFDYFWDIATFPQFDDRDQREVAVAYLVRGVFDAGKAIAQGDIGGTQP